MGELVKLLKVCIIESKLPVWTLYISNYADYAEMCER